MIKRPKISIIGAAGNVGASVMQWCAQKKLADLVLIDLKPNVAHGKALDLYQAAAFQGYDFHFEVSDDYSKIEGSDVVVITAGLARKPGQTREELVVVNAGIMKSVCEQVKIHAKDSIVIVVANPLDAMLTVAKQVTGFPKQRMIGMSGVLDSSRFKANIARATKSSIQDVSAIVIGAHTDKDMVPVVSTATVGGVPLTQLLSEAEIADVVAKTKKGGAEITELVGASAWVAPGAGVTAMLESIVLDSGRILPCSTELSGEFGISDQSCLCVPTQLGKEGVMRILDLKLSPEEKAAFEASYKAYLIVRAAALDCIKK